MKVKKVSIPTGCLISEVKPVDYSDAFEAIIAADVDFSLQEIQMEFWGGRPNWAIRLMKLRNWLVKPLGLKTDNILTKQRIKEIIDRKENNPGLSFYGSNPNEIVLYKDDKHLRFYFSTSSAIIENRIKLSASTIVQIHNRIGRAYFFFIAPFHFILVKWQFKRILQRMLKRNNSLQ